MEPIVPDAGEKCVDERRDVRFRLLSPRIGWPKTKRLGNHGGKRHALDTEAWIHGVEVAGAQAREMLGLARRLSGAARMPST